MSKVISLQEKRTNSILNRVEKVLNTIVVRYGYVLELNGDLKAKPSTETKTVEYKDGVLLYNEDYVKSMSEKQLFLSLFITFTASTMEKERIKKESLQFILGQLPKVNV